MTSNKHINNTIHEIEQGQLNQINHSEIKRYLTSLDDKDEYDELSQFVQWYENYLEFYILRDLFLEPCWEEIFLFGPDKIYIKNNQNQKKEINLKIEPIYWEIMISALLIKSNHELNLLNPFSSFYSKIHGQQTRVTILHHATGLQTYHHVFIRKISDEIIKLNQFSINEDLENQLIGLIHEKKNIVICGGTGSGKTTLLSSLLEHIHEQENIVVIEDTREINLIQPMQTRFLAKKSNNFHLKDYVTYSLRMSPDRIILGEIRSHEIVPFILAGNNGHKGMLTTVHANSCASALERMSTLFSIFSEKSDIKFTQIQKMLASSIDYIIHIQNKAISEVIQIYGHNGERLIFEKVN